MAIADAVASGASLTSSTKIVIEKKEHPDGWDWELKSVTYQKEHYNDTQNIKTFLLVATIFKEIASLPGDILKLHFLQFNLSVPYIKTRLLRAENIRHHCPTLAMVINALDTRDIDCYFQFYTGKWTEKLYLTSIHQDGGDAHSRLWRILFRVFGATTFFTSERRQDAFYRATCDMPRATVATKKAFCGVLEDMSNNRVHHAAEKSLGGLPGFVVMAETRGNVVDSSHAKLVVQAFEEVANRLYVDFATGKLPSLEELETCLSHSDEALFHTHNGRVHALDPFVPRYARNFTAEVARLRTSYKQSVSGDFRYFRDEQYPEDSRSTSPVDSIGMWMCCL